LINWSQHEKFSITEGEDGSSLVVTLWGSVEVTRPRRVYDDDICAVIVHATSNDSLAGYEVTFPKPMSILCFKNLAFVYCRKPVVEDSVMAIFEDRFLKVFRSNDIDGLKNFCVTLKYSTKDSSNE
jgi:hypothetical protein